MSRPYDPEADDELERNAGRPLSAPTLRGPAILNPFNFPPRGLALPTMSQVMSEPNLRAEHLAQDERHENTALRSEFQDMLQDLDSQCRQREYDLKRAVGKEVAVLKTRAASDRTRKNTAVILDYDNPRPEQPPWVAFNDPPEYFEKPRPGLLLEKSNSYHHNPLLQGMFVNPGAKPPHWEYNVHGGWSPHSRNENGSAFGSVPDRHASDKERMYQEKLKKTLKRAESAPKRLLPAEANVEAALQKSKAQHAKPWAWGRQTAHEIFMPIDPYKPGELTHEEGLHEHVVQPERALNNQRQIIVGKNERTDFWVEPKGGYVAGTAVRAAKAKLALAPRGCTELRAEARKGLNDSLRPSSAPLLKGRRRVSFQASSSVQTAKGGG
mmetsp:Transcript_63524/g.113016  ORF Transcript_63524/g.113016 Transcript_63524/m.113016 type:complete len:382 (+) Transcript_63524:116-1261(+)